MPRDEVFKEHIDNEFTRFIGKHGRKYKTSHEHATRKDIFVQNLRYIHSTNRAKLGFSVGVNHLADKTHDEIKALRGYRSSGIYNGKCFILFSCN